MQHASCICQFAGMCVTSAAIAVLGAEWQILPSLRELLFPGRGLTKNLPQDVVKSANQTYQEQCIDYLDVNMCGKLVSCSLFSLRITK